MSSEMTPVKKFKKEERYFKGAGPPANITGSIKEADEGSSWPRGRGGFQRGRGGFGRGRGGFDRGRGKISRGRGGFQRGRGGFGRGRGVSSGSFRGRGGFDRAFDHKSHVGVESIPPSILNLPLFNLSHKLKGFTLEEFDGWSHDDLFIFLKYAFRLSCNGINDIWDKFYIRGAGEKNEPDAKKRVWKKLIECLPPPTLEDTLLSCKKYICSGIGIEKLANENPEWKNLQFHKPPMVLREEVIAALGECKVSSNVLFYALSPSAKSIIICKYIDQKEKFYIAASDFFKKYPESFPWENREVWPKTETVLKVD